jgi:hypothetical protein
MIVDGGIIDVTIEVVNWLVVDDEVAKTRSVALVCIIVTCPCEWIVIVLGFGSSVKVIVVMDVEVTQLHVWRYITVDTCILSDAEGIGPDTLPYTARAPFNNSKMERMDIVGPSLVCRNYLLNLLRSAAMFQFLPHRFR